MKKEKTIERDAELNPNVYNELVFLKISDEWIQIARH
jgi:hypothetical protein